MSENNPFDPDELARQARQYLQTLKEAGLEWLPLGELPEMETTPPDGTGSSETSAPGETPSATSTSGLFTPLLEEQSDTESRRIALDLLKEQVSTCSRCSELLASRTQTVFGEGPLDAELCFIGEAPGYNEDQQGRPFVGEAGQLLDKIIAACGFQRDQVYICNILRCRPPGNRTPLANEAANCREYLERQLELVSPRFICAMGACASQNLLGSIEGIGRLRRRFHEYKGIPVLCTYHPAYLLRAPEKKRDVWEDLKMLLTRMGREIPGKKG